MDDIGSLLKKFRGVPERLERNLAIAVRMAAESAADEAKQNHDYTDRSGNLTNSIAADGPTGSFRNGDLNAIVSAGAGYAVFVEKGTKPHVIKPRFRKALRFPVASGFVFAKSVNHPGTRGRFFLRNAVQKTVPKMVSELVPDAVELSFVQAGFARGQ